MKSLLPIALAVGLGCGARSSLETSSGGDGAGNQGNGGAGAGIPSGGSGATGGGGSEPIVCGELVVDGAPITLDLANEPLAFSERDAKLVSVDGDRVMVFTTRTFLGAEGAELHATTFDAWEDFWPSTQGPANSIASAIRKGTAVGPGLADDASVVLPLIELGTPGAVLPALAPSVLPALAYAEVPSAFLFFLGGLPQTPQFVLAQSLFDFRVGVAADAGDAWYLVRMTADSNGQPMSDVDGTSGCGDSRTIGRAVATSAGVLTAMTSGQPYAACLDGDGPAGPPTRLQVELSVAGDAGLAFERVASEPFAEIELVATISGAWLIMRTDGSTSVTPPAVVAQRLSASGEPQGEFVVVVGDSETQGPLALAPLGDGFAIAYAGGLNAESPSISVALFDSDAGLISQTAIDPLTNAIDSISLVASPSQRELVVAWAGSEDGALARAARVACEP